MSPALQPIVQNKITSLVHSKRPRIRLAQFDDYEQIAAVEARHGLTVKSRDQWLDLWLENPAYRELPAWPIGWVIENEEGKIAGSLGNIPTFFKFGGKQYVSAAGRGWAVDLPYRALSVMLLAHQLKQSSSDMNVITTPSPTTAALCSQLGWSRVPVGEWDRSQFWITNYAKAVQGYLDAKTSKLFSSVVGAIVSPPLLLRDAFSNWGTVYRNDYRFDWCTSFDKRFDRLWDELTQQNPDLLLAARDAETLSWHFKHPLLQKRTWILTVSSGSRMVGYAILENRDIQSLGLTRVLLVDFQALAKDPHMCAAMIQTILERCRREGIHILENMGCWIDKLQPILAPIHQRNLESWCYLYRITNPELQRSLQQTSSWYPTQYDGDASL